MISAKSSQIHMSTIPLIPGSELFKAMGPGHTKSLPGILVKYFQTIAFYLGSIVGTGACPVFEFVFSRAILDDYDIQGFRVIQCNVVPAGISA